MQCVLRRSFHVPFPTAALFKLASMSTDLRSPTAYKELSTTRLKQAGTRTAFNRSNMATVVCQSTHASVIEIPYFRQEGPSGGTSCLPSLMWDSIMTPMIFLSPERSCVQISSRTFGWLLWFFCELPSVHFISATGHTHKGAVDAHGCSQS